jgi:hypothetical protein
MISICIFWTQETLTGDMSDKLVFGHRLRQIRKTDDKLYDVLIHPTSTKTGFDTADIPRRRPCDLFRTFDDDRVSCEQGCQDWGDEVVERIVPRDEGSD